MVGMMVVMTGPGTVEPPLEELYLTPLLLRTSSGTRLLLAQAPPQAHSRSLRRGGCGSGSPQTEDTAHRKQDTGVPGAPLTGAMAVAVRKTVTLV